MNRVLIRGIVILQLCLCVQLHTRAEDFGHISGQLMLNDSWEKRIYVSHIRTFDKAYAISNDVILTSSPIDSLGNFSLDLSQVPSSWSLLRLHMVKKGTTPNAMVIGGLDENYTFMIAHQHSEITLSNTESLPLFNTIKLEGAPHMQTFYYIKQLIDYPGTLDYENALVEREFIEAAIFEKLKILADTCTNPLVSLYALSQTNFKTDLYENPEYYNRYLDKWETENSPYFNAFRLNFPQRSQPVVVSNSPKYLLTSVILLLLVPLGYYFYRQKRKGSIQELSVKEREIFDLLKEGMTNKEISQACNIELTTVKTHVSNIYAKLKIKSRKEALNLKTK